MKTTSTVLLILLLAGVLACPTRARALGTEFTYQGDLRQQGSPVTGNHDFRYRLFADETGGTALTPDVEFNVQPVNGGLFTHRIDFGDQFTGAARWLEVSVRASGSPDYLVLSPRQAITPAPYALHAEFVADDSVVSGNIVDRSIRTLDLQTSAVTGAEIANGGVATIDLADGSVTSAKLAAAAVTTDRIADAAVTAAKIADGAIGADQIDSSQVQLRLDAKCPEGHPLLGFDADSDAVCDDALTHVLAGEAARPSIASFVNQLYVAFVDTLNNDLLLATCEDRFCRPSPSSQLLDTDIGSSSSVALALRSGGNAFIAYHDAAATDLHAFDCNNQGCSSSTFRPLDSGGDAGLGVDVALRDDGAPVIAYVADAASPELRLYDCDDADCSSGSVRTLDTSDVSSTIRTSVTLTSNDLPVVFYGGSGASAGLHVYLCSNAACTSGGSFRLHHGAVAGIDSLMRSNGRPIVSHTDGAGGAVSVFDCGGLVCTSGTLRSIATASNSDDTAIGRSGVTDSTIAVVYHNASALRLHRCADASCTTGSANAFSSGFDLEGAPSLAFRTDGRPIVASEELDIDDDSRVRIDFCGNPDCAQ
jgi:hypothetical protein